MKTCFSIHCRACSNVTLHRPSRGAIASCLLIGGLIAGLGTGVVVDGATVTLAWDPPLQNMDGSQLADLAGYAIYYGTLGGALDIKGDVGNVTTATVANLSLGTTYVFGVTAYNVAGYESGMSSTVQWYAQSPLLPAINASPRSFSLASIRGSSPSAQQLLIWNSGGGTLSYSVSTTVSWITPTPATGSASREQDPISLTFDTGSLVVGTYSTAVVITSIEDPTHRFSIPVTLTVRSDATVRWHVAAGDSVHSSPALAADGTVYAGANNGKLLAMTSTGAVKWEYVTGGRVSSSPAVGPDGTVYVGSDEGRLHAVTSLGARKWACAVGGAVSWSSAAIASDGTIYVGGYDGRLHAVGPDGTLRWTLQTGGMVLSSPAVAADGTIYTGSHDGRVYAVTPAGEKKWEYLTGGIVISSPAVGPDGTVYVGSADGRLYALTAAGGKQWAVPTGGQIQSSPVLGKDGTVYVGSYDGLLYAVGAAGTVNWTFDAGDPIFATVAVADNGTMYVGTLGGRMLALASDQSIVWEYVAADMVFASPSVAADGTVYMGCDAGVTAISGVAKLASSPSPWAKFRGNIENTGRQTPRKPGRGGGGGGGAKPAR